jgi:hypothetical protein
MRRGVWLACGLAVMMIACATLHTSPAQAGKRLALVIGNNDYENVPKLQKAVKRGRDLARARQALHEDSAQDPIDAGAAHLRGWHDLARAEFHRPK